MIPLFRTMERLKVKERSGLIGFSMPRGAKVTLICVVFPSYSTQVWIGPLPMRGRFVNMPFLPLL